MTQAEQTQTIANPPDDGITTVNYLCDNTHLFVSSWDDKLRLYNCPNNTLVHSWEETCPVLSCSSDEFGNGYSSLANGDVKLYDISTQNSFTLGKHDAAVKFLKFNFGTRLLVSGSWDGTVRQWDPRNPDRKSVSTTSVPGKVFALDSLKDKIVVCLSSGRIQTYDGRNMLSPLFDTESPLKMQMRAVGIFLSLEGYVVGGTEGKVGVEYFLDGQGGTRTRNYQFRCHRVKTADQEEVHPVNAIDFHPIHGTFATGGCDGVVNIWDGENRKRLAHFQDFPTSISSLSFSPNGQFLAIASSYTWEKGDIEHPKDQIFIRTLLEADTKRKIIA
ncbi:putative Mitotic checkpoint protein BUB3 [Blattamonas nauphoetae]|uniref:Mitotic checkpoint protein BUB3 n=1 Tax=Blattamonas nauphoetae TaxID=2049346 RepID=A0ABQ9XND2_9EUKA|nr:putative Mitotic checkpoint protein BUB3 [Blattamonas nauphoetae]